MFKPTNTFEFPIEDENLVIVANAERGRGPVAYASFQAENRSPPREDPYAEVRRRAGWTYTIQAMDLESKRSNAAALPTTPCINSSPAA